MTTKVTVDTHAGWPVEVIRINEKTGNRVSESVIVAPNTQQDFNIWEGSDLLIHEVQPEKAA